MIKLKKIFMIEERFKHITVEGVYSGGTVISKPIK